MDLQHFVVMKLGPVQIIAWNEDKGSEDLFKAAAMARAENEATGRKHQQRKYHNPSIMVTTIMLALRKGTVLLATGCK